MSSGAEIVNNFHKKKNRPLFLFFIFTFSATLTLHSQALWWEIIFTLGWSYLYLLCERWSGNHRFYLPFAIHHSPFVIRHSPLAIRLFGLSASADVDLLRRSSHTSIPRTSIL